MLPQEIAEIRLRHESRAAKPRDPQAQEDMGLLLGEMERMKANYKIACNDLDTIMLHYRNVLPEAIRDTLDSTRERVRGLL